MSPFQMLIETYRPFCSRSVEPRIQIDPGTSRDGKVEYKVTVSVGWNDEQRVAVRDATGPTPEDAAQAILDEIELARSPDAPRD